jgi:putative tributyrin esterase
MICRSPQADPHPGFDLRHRSIGLDREKRVRIVLPTASSAGRKAPLCILLHGFGGNRLAWFSEGGDRVRRMARRCALVLPESGRRWFINDDAGYRYESYLVDELVPALRETLPDHVETSRIVLGGFSMGGAAAVFLALRYPRLFPAVYSYGGAFFANRRTGDPYASVRDDDCMMPLQGEHDRVWGARGSRTRATYDSQPAHAPCAWDRRGSSFLRRSPRRSLLVVGFTSDGAGLGTASRSR